MKRRHIFAGLAALAVGVVVAGFAVGARAASSSPGEGSSSSDDLTTEELVLGQDMVMSVLDPLMALVNPTEGGERVTGDGAEYGYAGVIAHPESRELDVYWVGEVEAKAQAILDSAPAGLTVRVNQASYKLFELLDAVDRVVGSGADSSFLVISAGPEADGSGIWVEYSGSAEPEAVE